MKQMMIRACNWLNGWRRDHDDWWVRARREGDEAALGPNPMRGFLEEACVAVMTPEDAFELDWGWKLDTHSY